MKYIPSYGKILALGSPRTETALTGRVVIQEKVDGSQFRFGVNEEGKFLAGSKSVDFQEGAVDQMFSPGVEYLQSLDITSILPNDTYVYGEYLRTERHNTLKYDRVPKNHLVIFDVLEQGKFVSREELEVYAEKLGVDIIPEIFVGELADGKAVLEMLDVESFLGGVKIEGVVLKNYNQWFTLGGNVFPMFTKYVSEDFKEKHKLNPEYLNKEDALQILAESYRTEARWEKAVQHLRDRGELLGEPKDIGKLMEEVMQDLLTEERESIKEELFKLYHKNIVRNSSRGLPEWYKQKLLERVL